MSVDDNDSDIDPLAVAKASARLGTGSVEVMRDGQGGWAVYLDKDLVGSICDDEKSSWDEFIREIHGKWCTFENPWRAAECDDIVITRYASGVFQSDPVIVNGDGSGSAVITLLDTTSSDSDFDQRNDTPLDEGLSLVLTKGKDFVAHTNFGDKGDK